MRKFRVKLSYGDGEFIDKVVIEAKNEYDLIDKIKSHSELSEHIYSDEGLKDWHGGVMNGKFVYDEYESLIWESEEDDKIFYLALNEDIEFEVFKV